MWIYEFVLGFFVDCMFVLNSAQVVNILCLKFGRQLLIACKESSLKWRVIVSQVGSKNLLPYLAVDCVSVESVASQHLWSAVSGCFAVTGTNTSLGKRNFAVAGAKIWNSQPAHLRSPTQSLQTFWVPRLNVMKFVYVPWVHLRIFLFLHYSNVLVITHSNADWWWIPWSVFRYYFEGPCGTTLPKALAIHESEPH